MSSCTDSYDCQNECNVRTSEEARESRDDAYFQGQIGRVNRVDARDKCL